MRPKLKRDWKVIFTTTKGRRIETKRLTLAEADRKMRTTQWTPGSAPLIVRAGR